MGQTRWGSVSGGHWGEMECQINAGSGQLPLSPLLKARFERLLHLARKVMWVHWNGMLGVLSKSISVPIFIYNNVSKEILEYSQIMKEFTFFWIKIARVLWNWICEKLDLLVNLKIQF